MRGRLVAVVDVPVRSRRHRGAQRAAGGDLPASGQLQGGGGAVQHGFLRRPVHLLIRLPHGQAAPLVWVWDNLNIHLAPDLADFAEQNKEWLRIYRLPAYAPDMNPAEGIWSLLKRSMANFAAADLDGLVRIIKRKLKKIQYRPHLIDGCLAATGLTLEPW